MRDKLISIIDNFKRYFEESNFKTLTVMDWKNIFSKELSHIFSTRPYSIDPKWLYRARLNFDCDKRPIDFFKNTSALWAPPRKKIKQQGRCNTAGQSLLYCSSNPTTTLFETKPETGTEITVMEYKLLGEIGQVGVVGVKDVMTIGEDYKNIFSNHFQNSTEETMLLDDILSGVFKSKTENIKAYPIYNLTNAVTKIFLHNQKNDLIPQHLIPPKSIGLIYPSVETIITLGINIVMEPREVKNKLKPNIAYKYKIIKRHDLHFYEILLTHRTKKIYPNGEMAWELKRDNQTEYITDLPRQNNAKTGEGLKKSQSADDLYGVPK